MISNWRDGPPFSEASRPLLVSAVGCPSLGAKMKEWWEYADHYRDYESRKRAAGNEMRRALARGLLTKPSACERCGKVLPGALLHGHHRDYDKPLSVEFLCARCHGFRHRRRGN